MKLLIFVFVLVLSGCATRIVNLYPYNEAATSTGVLTGKLAFNSGFSGTIEIIAPDGEIFQGQFSLVNGGASSFSSTYNSVYGTTGGTNRISSPNSSRGDASAYSNKGVSIHCEFIHDNMWGHGSGACLTSKNAVYKLQY